jgi:Raf kinase inhibitor-like YbhB/YbcL family protein
MRLSSTAFSERSTILQCFTCDGEDISPPLEWSDAAAGTRCFVLLCDDPDAPSGTWHHWAAYDIPVDRTGFAASGASRAVEEAGFRQAINDFRRHGHGCPCPPRRHGPQCYHFRLLALSLDHLPIRQTPMCRHVEREARKHVLAEAVLVGPYQR